jgi:hypothetical protein
LELSWVPTVPFESAFDAQMSSEEFTLAWNVSDNFKVGVFRGSGIYGGDKSYADDTGATPITRTLSQAGSTSVSGLRFTTGLPQLSFLSVGIEVGTMTLGATTAGFSESNGDGTTSESDFTPGGAPGSLDFASTTAPLIGVLAKATVISAQGSTVTTEINVSVAFRMVDTGDVSLFGTQEVSTIKAPLLKTAIGQIENYNNLAIAIGASLWF